jgi:hypothetical protein
MCLHHVIELPLYMRMLMDLKMMIISTAFYKQSTVILFCIRPQFRCLKHYEIVKYEQQQQYYIRISFICVCNSNLLICLFN